jgi:hypothetical protein
LGMSPTKGRSSDCFGKCPSYGDRSTHTTPVTSSTNLPVPRSSTTSNDNVPVAPASFPVPPVTPAVALNSPVLRSIVPAIDAVSVPCLVGQPGKWAGNEAANLECLPLIGQRTAAPSHAATCRLRVTAQRCRRSRKRLGLM